MKKTPIIRIQDLLGLLHSLYPAALAESWDNVGLQVGEPEKPVSKILICLDPTEKALAQACEVGAQAIISHHPLIFKPLKNITATTPTGRFILDAARSGIAHLCAHTNLDRAKNGLNDWLAQALGLKRTRPLQSSSGDLLKLVVFVPCGYEGVVSDALFAAGAGAIGDYDQCSFEAPGAGGYRPGAGTEPFLGSQGERYRTRETRIESVVPRGTLNRVLTRMIKAHPYEEVAYDLIALENRREDVGLGRIGHLEKAENFEAFARRVQQQLCSGSLRYVGDGQKAVRKIALCGGSGASLISEAIRQGADVLVTGDIKYHEAQIARDAGLGLIDAGHFATERIMVPGLRGALCAEAHKRSMALEFVEMQNEEDPFRLLV